MLSLKQNLRPDVDELLQLKLFSSFSLDLKMNLTPSN